MAQFKCLLTGVPHFGGQTVGVLAFDSNRALMVSPEGKLKWIVVSDKMICIDPTPGKVGNVEPNRLEDEKRREDVSKFSQGIGSGSGSGPVSDKTDVVEDKDEKKPEASTETSEAPAESPK